MQVARSVLHLSLPLVWLQLAIIGSQAAGQALPASPSPGTARPGISCVVDTSPPSDAEKALSRRDYKAAFDLFQKMENSSPEVARAGMIRALLKLEKLQDAIDRGKKWQEAEPGSGPAKEIWGEVLFRKGELPDALRTLFESRKLDPCNPRALLMIARIENLLGDHATAAHQIATAHMLAPRQIDVGSAWMSTQARSKQRENEAAAAKDEALLNAGDRKRLAESLAHEKDYSKSDCQSVQPVAEEDLHMEEMMADSSHRQGLGLNVKFNGSQRTLEIDSGASGILLSRKAAYRLHLVHDEKLMVGGVGDEGDIQSAVAHVDSIRIGRLEFKNCPATILEKNDKLEIDGLIGTDFFKKYLVTLDFPARRVRLGPLPKRPGESKDEDTAQSDEEAPVFHDRYIAPEMKDWSMVWRSGHDLILPVSIGGAKDKLFIIDTGAGLMSISPAAAREVTRVHGDFDTRVTGISGEVDHVYATQKLLVTFGHVRLHVRSMTAMNTDSLSSGEGFEISGFLGAPVLDRLVLQIDYRDNLVNLLYDEKKDPENLAPIPFY